MLDQDDFRRIYTQSSDYDEAVGYAVARLRDELQGESDSWDAPLYARLGAILGRAIGKLAQYSDANPGLRASCPNFQPKHFGMKVRHDFHFLIAYMTTEHFSGDEGKTDLQPLHRVPHSWSGTSLMVHGLSELSAQNPMIRSDLSEPSPNLPAIAYSMRNLPLDKTGKLGEYSDANTGLRPPCPNFRPKNVWMKIRTDFQSQAYFLQ